MNPRSSQALRLDLPVSADGVETIQEAVVIDLRSQPPVLRLDGGDQLTLEQALPSRWSRAAVRVFDLALVVPAFVVALVPMVVIGLLVAITSRGPALYASTRQTRSGRVFKMWKFRSMVVDADAVLAQYLADDPDARELFERHHKFKKDPRVTKVGRVLRGLSLDELPQLWNVVRGDMSIVGPRPRLDWETERFGTAAATVERVKGGLTGAWQAGGRNDIPFHERLVIEVDYALHRSLWTDAKIVVRTAWQLLKGSPGAY
ncbi:MAG: sugar transferase [Acidimicrobiales bacterium]